MFFETVPIETLFLYVKISSLVKVDKLVSSSPLVSAICPTLQDVKIKQNTIKIKIWSGGRNLFGPHHYQIEPPGVGPNTYELVGTWVDGVSSDETLDYSFKKFGLD